MAWGLDGEENEGKVGRGWLYANWKDGNDDEGILKQ